MSIAPVTEVPAVEHVRSQSVSLGSGPSQIRPQPSAAEPSAQPVLGAVPKPESRFVKSAPSTYELPQDVVEVHQDPAIKGQVIIQYLDQSGNVVVQVPSAQELSVERGIAEEFQQEDKLRASEVTTTADHAGGKIHGD